MCGIIGIVGCSPAAPRLIEALKRLEYRGYDSAGIALADTLGVHRYRSTGKIHNLESVLPPSEEMPAMTGIGHTRWATHGAPTVLNAHPHSSGAVTLVHNGIIENYRELKADLLAEGFSFESQTDTEVVAHLLAQQLKILPDPIEALKSVLDRLTGAYALAVIIEGDSGAILGARRGSPLVIGWGDGEMYLGSDALAVGQLSQTVSYLEEGDMVVLRADDARVFDQYGMQVERPPVHIPPSAAMVEKGEYRHFMEKEIHEQPDSVQHTLSHYLDAVEGTTKDFGLDFSAIDRIQIVACGTSFYAGLIGKYAVEAISGLPCDVEIASEFRYRNPAISRGTLALGISQSGETADTLASLLWCKQQGIQTAALLNVHSSSMAREADILWPTHAGPEIGVASTKAFSAQVSVLLCAAVAAGKQRRRLSDAQESDLVSALFEVPRLISEAMAMDAGLRDAALDLARASDVLFLGRGMMFPLALEGALKLKEISYIHAEGYAAGELKHGPLALIDENTPTVVLAPLDELFDKTASNLQEVAARSGPVIVIAPARAPGLTGEGIKHIVAPDCHPLAAPLIYVIAVQLLAYYTALQKGTDVDQPRNLAKSVTVE